MSLELVAAAEPTAEIAGRAFFLLLVLGLAVWAFVMGGRRSREARFAAGWYAGGTLAILLFLAGIPSFLAALR